MPDAHTALRQLNDAAYAALRAVKSTPGIMPADRDKLRQLAAVTDRLVDSLPAKGS